MRQQARIMEQKIRSVHAGAFLQHSQRNVWSLKTQRTYCTGSFGSKLSQKHVADFILIFF